MSRPAKLLAGIGIGLGLIALVAVAGGYWYLFARSFPQTTGEIEVPGLESSVAVYRDRWGVPHIYAESARDLFFAQGFVTAQDRLWQMEFHRRAGSGTLSEVLGPGALEADRFVRTLGWRRIAEAEVRLLDAESRENLEAYSAGVNAFIGGHRGRLPPEFTILGFEPHPWSPADTLAFAKLMAWTLGGNWETELLRARLVRALGEDRAWELAPVNPEGERPIVRSLSPPLGGLDLERTVARAAALDQVTGLGGSGLGSNSWVVAGSRSATGSPILANDTHLPIQMPSIWYEIHLEGGGLRAAGFSFPAAPAVLIGHNDHIAWGTTNLGPDVQDLYVEEMDPENPDRYLYDGEWQDMQILLETISVKGWPEPVVERVRLTRHGPVISPVSDQVTEILGEDAVVSLRWTALEPDPGVVVAFLRLNRARNWEEFREALSHYTAPSQNFIFADRKGHIGYQTPGKIPIRATGHAGLMPVPGWTGEYEYDGYIPFDELPHVLDPADGYIVTANNRVVGEGYPYELAHDWAIGHRAERIADLLESRPQHSVEGFRQIQADAYYRPAEPFIEHLLALQPEGFLEERAMNELRRWDLRNEPDQTGASIFHTFYWKLAERTFADELGDLFPEYLAAATKHLLVLSALMDDPTSAWFDDQTTPEIESRDEIVRAAFRDALDFLGRRYGDAPHDWGWGRLHSATFSHQPLGGVDPLGLLFNRGPVSAPGAAWTVFASRYSFAALGNADPVNAANPRLFSTSSVSSQRMIVD
ncbi:MAG: penicillin acylase family protein, partial [Anaerolineae bacterium]